MPRPSEEPRAEPPHDRGPVQDAALNDERDEDLVPRPSKMRYIALLFAGMFIGRIASTNFAPGALDLLDLAMYAGLALSLAWAWRTWARQAMIQRHLAAERRRQRASSPAPRPPKRSKR